MKEFVQVVGGAGLVEATQPPDILDGAEQRIVIMRHRGLKAFRGGFRDDQRRYLVAGGSFTLIPRDEQEAALLSGGAV